MTALAVGVWLAIGFLGAATVWALSHFGRMRP